MPRRWHDFVQDLRYAARTLLRSPGYALTAIATLATGVLACLGPARRATSIDPLVALRSE